MPLLDPEMAVPLQETLTQNKIAVHLNDSAVGFSKNSGEENTSLTPIRHHKSKPTWCLCALV